MMKGCKLQSRYPWVLLYHRCCLGLFTAFIFY